MISHGQKKGRFFRLALLLGLFALVLSANALFFVRNVEAAGTTYYVDCSASGKGNGTQSSPWKALSSVNATTFLPGSQILFKRGTGVACIGTLHPLGSGTSGNPIIIDTYGTGSLPVIAGNGAANAVYLFNQQYWEIRNLEITNQGSSSANRRGVEVVGQNIGTLNYFRLTNLSIHNVNGDDTKDLGGSAGIQFEVEGTTTPTTFNDIIIQGNTIKTVDRSGINSSSSWEGDRPTSGSSAWPTGWTNYIIRNNTVSDIGGDGIVVQHANGALVDHNTVNGANLRSKGCNAGIWAWDANNTTFQYNEVYNVGTGSQTSGCDSEGYDVDYNQDNTLFQYNYSHNNAGGFILDCRFCGSPNGTNPTVRDNISVNDAGNHDFVGGTTYNDTVYRDSGTGATFGTISGYNNIYYEGKPTTDNVSCSGNCDYNDVYGLSVSGGNSHGVTANPLFTSLGNYGIGITTLSGFQLQTGSPALGSGTVIANNGGLDFYGNSVSSTAAPNIGAYNGPGMTVTPSTNLVLNPGLESGVLGPWGQWNDVSVVNSNAHSGTYALRDGAGPSSSEQTISGLLANTTYTLTGWGKVATSGETVAIGVKNFGGTETSQSISTTSYSQASVTFTTGLSNNSATIYFYKASGTGYAYGDDFSLTYVSTGNLVQNPGLESGTLSPWSQWNDVSVVNSNAHSGTYALRDGAGPCTSEQVVNGLLPNTTYTLSGWGKVDTSGQTVSIGVKNFGGTETSQLISTTSYSQVSITFTTGSSSTSATIYFYRSSGTGYAYGDDFSVIAS